MSEMITPHLWYDREAKEAARFYTSVFDDSRIKNTTTLDNTPSGSVDIVTVEILGQEFTFISAGPLFKFTPAVSFFVTCDTKEEVDALWKKLAEGGQPLMELGAYPFSERYGWIQDKYGLSWQLGFMAEALGTQRIIPTMLFVGDVAGRAEEAIRFYTSVFRNAKIGDIHRYAKGEEPDREGTVKYGSFTLEGQQFAAMDSAREHKFGFNEAVSLMVHCDTQAQIDYYWGKLSADPKSEQCGWLKDKFGVSWQVTPRILQEMIETGDRDQVARVTEAFLKMKKFDLAKLKEAFEGTRETAGARR